jgi:hypothetical protein
MAEATNLPWFVHNPQPGDGGSGPHDRVIVGGHFVEADEEDGNEYPACVVIAHVKGNATAGDIPTANAELIVRAVNCHAALLAACKEALAHAVADPISRLDQRQLNLLRKAVALAEGTNG